MITTVLLAIQNEDLEMPTFDYECSECHYTFSEFLKIDDRLLPESLPCKECNTINIKKVITTAPPRLDPVRLGITRPPSGFRDVLQKIDERAAISMHGKSIADQSSLTRM